MHRSFKRTLIQILNSKRSLNRKAILWKHSFDEICRMVDRLACGQCHGKKKK